MNEANWGSASYCFLAKPPVSTSVSMPTLARRGLGSVLLDVQRVKQGLDVHAVITCASRQVGAFTPVKQRSMTWDIDQ
ncbi:MULTISPECIES: hypothetical protein [unclassified Streptomyces]|uniref:hypothetical protein n=1 Tax=Streptomyces sp. LamerLS-31b TaxID=1839765 RepID=UPI00159F14D8|nr:MULTISPECIES: hypothetical protein [unclassified Streptomyces]